MGILARSILVRRASRSKFLPDAVRLAEQLESDTCELPILGLGQIATL